MSDEGAACFFSSPFFPFSFCFLWLTFCVFCLFCGFSLVGFLLGFCLFYDFLLAFCSTLFVLWLFFAGFILFF